MSRAQEGDSDNPAVYLWDSYVKRSIRSRRGQSALRGMVSALDAMPCKELAAGSFRSDAGMCTLGVWASATGVDTASLESCEDDYGYQEPVDIRAASSMLGIPKTLVWEIMHANDELGRHDETGEGRWFRMRSWCASRVRASTTEGAEPTTGEST